MQSSVASADLPLTRRRLEAASDTGESNVIIGVPTEVKSAERRVGLTPTSVREVTAAGHRVVVQAGAGIGLNKTDEDYERAGATIAPTAADVWADAEMIVKVKEPQAAERAMLRRGQVLFTYLHLAPDPDQTRDLVASGATCIAYETVTDDHGRLPLLAPMSRSRAACPSRPAPSRWNRPTVVRACCSAAYPVWPPPRWSSSAAASSASTPPRWRSGMGADVTVLDRDLDVLNALDARFDARITTLYSTTDALEERVLGADLVIGAVLVKGARAPKLVTASMVHDMKPGSVLVDVAIDQGGCFETSKPTTHDDPTYLVDGIVHYCVANMPGGVPKTSTYALTNATLPFVLRLAASPIDMLRLDPHLRNGLNVHDGLVTEAAVADALGYDYVDPLAALA